MYGFIEPFVSSQVDGAALTAAAEATMLPAAAIKPVPANYFDTIGMQLEIEAWGKISSVITTPGTARFKVYLGATAVFDGLAVLLDSVAGHTDVGWHLRCLLTLRALGASANFMGQGEWGSEDILGTPASAPKGSLVARLPWNSAPAVGSNFDSTTALALDVKFTQTVATGSLTCQQYAALIRRF